MHAVSKLDEIEAATIDPTWWSAVLPLRDDDAVGCWQRGLRLGRWSFVI